MIGRPSRWFLLGVLGCMLVGFGVRWTNIVVARPVCDIRERAEGDDCYTLFPGPNDAIYRYEQGRLINAGHWFVNPYVGDDPAVDDDPPPGRYQRSLKDPPLYQLFLATNGWLGNDGPQGQRLASALVGLLTVPLLALLARRLAGDAAGLVAAAIAALHPLLWINDGMLLAEALYAPLIAAVLLAAVWFRDGPSAWRVAVLTFLICAAAFTRGEAALLLPVIVAPLVLGTRRLLPSTRVAYGAIALAVAGAWFLPWNLWANSQFEERVFMTSSSGSVLSASACDEHFYGEPLALFIYCPRDVVIPPGADESEQDLIVREDATDYIRDNLDRLPVVAAVRVGRMWDVYGPAENLEANIETETRGEFASRAGQAVYYGLLPFVVVGLVSLRRRGELIWPYLGLAAMVTATAALTFGLTRYRVPVDVTMVPLAAVGLVATATALRARFDSGAPGEPAAQPVGDAPPGDQTERLDDDA